jgi:hypothetical protein
MEAASRLVRNLKALRHIRDRMISGMATRTDSEALATLINEAMAAIPVIPMSPIPIAQAKSCCPAVRHRPRPHGRAPLIAWQLWAGCPPFATQDSRAHWGDFLVRLGNFLARWPILHRLLPSATGVAISKISEPLSGLLMSAGPEAR